MRLKSLWIDGFKNLNDFKIDFESRDGITVLIGNNASGKSNVLEVISAIFAGLYNDKLKELNFKFDLTYNIDNLDVRISKKQKVKYRTKKISNKSWNELKGLYSPGGIRLPAKLPAVFGAPYDYRPSQVIALYSGEEFRLRRNYYQNFFKKYNKDVVAGTIPIESKQKMLYINKNYWVIALLTMWASDIKFSDITNGSELEEIKLRFNLNNINSFKTNEVVHFAKSLCDGKKTARINIEKFKSLIGYETHNRLFNLLCVSNLFRDKLKVKEDKVISKGHLIDKIDLFFSNKETVFSLSEGQKKQILLKLALEILADENSLLLFDEPDAHIHISNKKLIPEILKNYSNREIVLTTHSPTLAHSFDNKHLAYIENGKINEDYNNKEKLLNELTNGLMGVSEQQILLQTDKDILIVEGKTDEFYISAALKALKADNNKYKDLEFKFLWLGGSDADTLKKIIEQFPPKENQTIIAFFDRDDSGKRCIKKTLDKTIIDDFDGEKKEGIYIYLYPKKNGFQGANFEVEDYFPIKMLKDFIFKESKSFQSLKSGFNSNKKANLVKKCQEDDFDKSNFDGFKVLFDKIIDIKKLNK